MVLIDGTIAIATTRVGEIAADGPLEERLAALARELSVVFAAALVAAHDTLDLLRVLVGSGARRWRRRLRRLQRQAGRAAHAAHVGRVDRHRHRRQRVAPGRHADESHGALAGPHVACGEESGGFEWQRA